MRRTIKKIIRYIDWFKCQLKWYPFYTIFTCMMIFFFLMFFFNQKEEYKQLNCDSGVVLKDCLNQMNISNGWFLEIGFMKFEKRASVEKQHEICMRLASNCKN